MSEARIGSVISDRYRVVEELSAGGMGVVYRGERVKLGRQVAIKFLHEAFSSHPDFRKRFEREARLMSRLEHPNIVSVIDFGVADSPYIVMDYVSGETLADLLDDGPLEPARAIRVVGQILGALAHAHRRDIIHRDIKPANVMLASTEGASDHVHLLDFGLAKLLDTDASLTMAAIGTPSYMSPEQARGKPADARSDLYSTGVLLYELLSGDKPFRADEPLAVLQMHIHEAPPPLDGVSPALAAVVMRSLAKDPDARYQTPSELREALESALAAPDDAPATEARTDDGPAGPARDARSGPKDVPHVMRPPAPTPAPAPAPGGGLGWLVALLVIGGLGAAGYWLFGGPTTPVVAGTAAHIESRKAEEEIRALHDQLRAHPERGALARRLGDLYVAKGWRSEALAAYVKAVSATPALRRDRALIANIIAALDDPATASRARAILVNHIGEPALGPLRAARGDAALIDEIKQRGRRR